MTAAECLHVPRPVGPIMPAMERAARGEASPHSERGGEPGPTVLRRSDATCPQCLDLLDTDRGEQYADGPDDTPTDPAAVEHALRIARAYTGRTDTDGGE